MTQLDLRHLRDLICGVLRLSCAPGFDVREEFLDLVVLAQRRESPSRRSLAISAFRPTQAHAIPEGATIVEAPCEIVDKQRATPVIVLGHRLVESADA